MSMARSTSIGLYSYRLWLTRIGLVAHSFQIIWTSMRHSSSTKNRSSPPRLSAWQGNPRRSVRNEFKPRHQHGHASSAMLRQQIRTEYRDKVAFPRLYNSLPRSDSTSAYHTTSSFPAMKLGQLRRSWTPTLTSFCSSRWVDTEQPTFQVRVSSILLRGITQSCQISPMQVRQLCGPGVVFRSPCSPTPTPTL